MRGRSMPRAAAAAAAAAGGGGGPCAGGLVQPPGGPQRMGGGQLSLQHAIPVDVCTLHVSNLPVDFDERELFCLFGTMPGYMNATMMFDPVRPPVAFVTFNSAQAAAEATRIAGAMPWEPGCDQMFKIGLARSQQRVLAGDKRIHTVGVKPPQMRRRVSQMSAPHQHAAAADPWRGGPAAGGRGVGQAVALPAAGPVAGGGPFQQGYPVQPPGPQQCQHQQHQQQQQQQQQQGERGMLKFPLDSLPSGMEVSAFAAALRHQQQQEEKQRSGQPDAGRKDGKKKRPKGAEGDADRSGGRPGGGAGRDAHPDPAVITAVPAGGSQQSRATLQIGATGGPVQQLDQQQLILQMQAQQQQQLQLQQQQQLQLQLQVQQQQMLVQQPHAVAGAVPVNVVPAAVPLQQTIVPAAPLTPGEPQHGSHGFLQTSLGVAAPEPIRAEDLEAALS
eukprot:TRINITY_DN3936_c0_g1_i1.p1 TRINITY_DN3936_c0_g1~~TRINITY_DN3936_c0_g1_i1.p1  ORF type:complete len:445 (+),score=149.03 TRINITY_DN3936_c0_g1_i1:90-1424(+)